MITICLWFDDQADAAAEFYTSTLRDGRILRRAPYVEVSDPPHRKAPGSTMTVEFEVEGQRIIALNGGPEFTIDEAVSLVLHRETQEEIDELWEALLAGGGTPGPCGWLTDRFGVSWQVVPDGMDDLVGGPDQAGARRATEAMLRMGKLDIEELRRAYAGETAVR